MLVAFLEGSWMMAFEDRPREREPLGTQSVQHVELSWK